jgi:hypothetical protein
MRPIVRIDEFVFGQSPSVHFLLQWFWDPRVVRQEVEEALGVIDMRLPDRGPLGITGIRIFPTAANVIRRKRALIVEVCFVVWNRRDQYFFVTMGSPPEPLRLCGQPQGEEFIAMRIIAGRLGVGVWLAGSSDMIIRKL